MNSELCLGEAGVRTFPDLSDGTDITVYSNRVTNAYGKYKQINGNYYIEFSGTLNISINSTTSGYDTWLLSNNNELPLSVDVNKKNEVMLEIDDKCQYIIGIRLVTMATSSSPTTAVKLTSYNYTGSTVSLVGVNFKLRQIIYA